MHSGQRGKIKHEMWKKIFQYKKDIYSPKPLNTLIKKLYSDCPFWKQYLEYEYAKHARKNFYWYAMQIVFSCQLHYLSSLAKFFPFTYFDWTFVHSTEKNSGKKFFFSELFSFHTRVILSIHNKISIAASLC